jgi:hypothetical protein
MTRNSNRKKAIRDRVKETGEAYSVAARELGMIFGEPTSVGVEKCPGYLTWSAFGASYPDSVCSTVVEWEGDYQGWGLCDADDDFRDKGVPCPFHDPVQFMEYMYGGGFYVPFWSGTEQRLPNRTEIHFHEEGPYLWLSATHEKYGELKVTVRELDFPDEEFDNFEPYILSDGTKL